MDKVFSNSEVEPVVVNDAERKKVEAKENAKQKMKMMRSIIQETIQTDPDFTAKLHTLSQSIEVLNTLGYGTKGNIIEVKKNTDESGRELKPTSKIVGYRLRNVGTESIQYMTEEFAQDETGKWVGTKVEKTFAPGTTIELSRMYMTIFCSKPEISFILKNGTITGGSSKKGASLTEELSSRYFRFSKDENGATIPVNDDEVKLAIDNEDGVIKPEFEATFGYLNNPKETRARGSKTKDFTTQDLNANFIRKLLEEQKEMQ